jgi:hypothetical protein
MSRQKKQVAHAVTQGTEIRVLLVDEQDRSEYRSIGFVGQGIPIVREALEKMYEIFGKSLSDGVFQGYLTALSDLTDEEIFEGIGESVKRHAGEHPPLPAQIRQFGLRRRGRNTWPENDVRTSRMLECVRFFEHFPKGQRNLRICKAWDGRQIAVDPLWKVPSFEKAYADRVLRNRINVMISALLSTAST